jgi:iron complex transport system substrate-binding protein
LAGQTFGPLLALALTVAGLTSVCDQSLLASPSRERIVAIGGSVTEILYALNLGSDIVGVDTTSLYPPEALKTKPNVGYFRAFSAEGVLSLKPTLVIAADGAGPPDAIKLVRDSGVVVQTVSDDFSANGVIAKIDTVGHLVHAEDRAKQLSQSVAQSFRDLNTLRAGVDGRVRVLLVLAMPNGRPLVAGQNTAGDGMIKLADGINVAGDFDGYKQISDEAIIAASPDVIVMMQNGAHLPAEQIFAIPAFAATPAAAKRRLLQMDGISLLGFGPRTPQVAKQLLESFYPMTDVSH